MKIFRFKDWSVFQKLLFLIVSSIIPFLIIFSTIVIPNVSTKYYNDRENSLKNVVEAVHGILTVYNNKVKSGELSKDKAIQKAIDEINTLRFSGKEYFFMYDLDGNVMALGSAPEKKGENRLNLQDHNGTKFIKKMIETVKSKDEGFIEYYYPKLGENKPSPKLSFVKYFKPWNCFIGSGVYIDDVNENISAFKKSLNLPFAIAVILAISVGFFIARKSSAPLKELKENAEKMAKGNLDIKILYDGHDETGKVGLAFQMMVDNIRTQIREIEQKNMIAENAVQDSKAANQKIEDQRRYLTEMTQLLLKEMDKFSKGDLSVKMNIDGEDQLISNLFTGFNLAVKNMNDAIQKVSEAVKTTAGAAAGISSSTEEMAAGTQQQSMQVTEVASAVEEMTRTIMENSKNATFAAEAAKVAGSKAKDGGRSVNETIEGMERISKVVEISSGSIQALGNSSKEIGEIVQVIDDIADQTNLLALNAAIEAARAGEQGKGFAVVADEVRKLAEKTTSATKKIADMIRQIQKDTYSAVDSMKEGTEEVIKGKELAYKSGKILEEIITEAEKVNDVINQVAAANEEQSAVAEEISRNVEGMSNVSHESASGIEEIAKSAESLNNLTSGLEMLVRKFKIQNIKSSKESWSDKYVEELV